MKIQREDLLKQLESILPGLSARGIIEQSSCFVFKDKRVFTFNDEIACSQQTDLEIEGAVTALPFTGILRKLQEESIDISIDENEVLIKGKNRRAGLRLEKKIQLPIETVDIPKKWKDLPKDFAEAISMVQSCASTNESTFNLTCVHIDNQGVEACDGRQAARYKIANDVENPFLVRRDSLKHIIALDMTKFSETKSWVHFQNPTGLVMSCRRFIEKYPPIHEVMKVDGTPIILPKGLKEAAEKADVFSSEDTLGNYVSIRIQPGKIRIIGRGVSGWFAEFKKVEYTGKELEFTISPRLLADLVQKHDHCKITEDRLKIKSGKFEYVTVLGKPLKK